MSTTAANKAMQQLIASENPEVLCVRGRWGTGKTYSWDHQIKAACSNNSSSKKYYSYVSLFSLNSIEELRYAIFENTTVISDGKTRADLDTFHSWQKQLQTKKIVKIVSKIPIIGNIGGSALPALVSLMAIRNQIICIDDIERKGSALSIADILGLVSLLKEQRQCSVVILMNDGELDEEQQILFQKFSEKVVDRSVAYIPTADECAKIAKLKSDSLADTSDQLSRKLGITNIRVMRKIERTIRELNPLLAEYHPNVFESAAASVALFVASNLKASAAPSLEFIASHYNSAQFSSSPSKADWSEEGLTITEESVGAWVAFLNSYGYLNTSDFDLYLIDCVKNGFFPEDETKKHGAKENTRLVAQDAEGSFHEAWRDYHDSFEDNGPKVLNRLYKSFMKNYEYITPLNLSGTIRLFKELGEHDRAMEILNHYVQNRAQDRALFDLAGYAFASEIEDEDVISVFEKKYHELKSPLPVRGMLLELKGNYHSEYIANLRSTPVEEYVIAFKEAKGRDLREMINGCLQFKSLSNANEDQLEISSRAIKALKIIGKESTINARRVAKYGIIVDPSDADKQQ